jgi:hypothetical protein
MPEVPLANLSITDEDRVPLELLEEMITQLTRKQEFKEGLWYDIIKKARAEIAKKIRNSGASSDDMRRKIETNTFITTVNKALE